MKIAFLPAGGDDWMGGLELMKDQLHALKQTYGERVLIYLLEPVGPTQIGELADVRMPLIYPTRHSASWLLRIGTNYVAHLLLNSDHFISSVLRKNDIDAICGMGLSCRYGGIPSLAWLSDFQHMHCPQFFTEEEKRIMNAFYLRIAKSSSRILLYSHAVKMDFEKFIPQYADRVRVLHPAAAIPDRIYAMDPESIVRRYNLPEKFFYLPNNFAKHKNHGVVFQAVQLLNRRGLKVAVVCTGCEDSRRPSSFAKVWRTVSELGIRDQLIYVGLVPHDDLLMLMRQSICVLSPSLFEGWGLTVEEARSLGKKVIVSDIAPFREQDPPEAIYINPTDPVELADKMAEVWTQTEPGPDLGLEANARGEATARLKQNAERFIAIVNEAINQ